MRSLLICLLFWFPVVLFANVTPLPAQKPMKVQVGLFINNVTGMNETAQTISFIATMTVRWQDRRLAFNGHQQGSKEKLYMGKSAATFLQSIWHPHLVLGKNNKKRQAIARVLIVNAKGGVTYVERFNATVQMQMNFRLFPFDYQTFIIGLHPFYYSTALVHLMPWTSHQGLDKQAKLEQWNVTGVHAQVLQVRNAITHQASPEYRLIIHYHRTYLYYVFQIICPLILIVLLSFSVFWMTHNPLVNRVGISLTALLTIVVFQWRVFGNLPHVSYHTFLDSFMLYSLFVTGLTLIFSIVIENARQAKDCIIRWFRIGVPIVYLLGALILVLMFFA